MKKQQIPLKNSLLLLLTATIWGISFVAQSEGGDAVGAFTFNAHTKPDRLACAGSGNPSPWKTKSIRQGCKQLFRI